MKIVKYPAQYGSAFREACFVLETQTEESVDVAVHDARSGRKLGAKRVYGPGEIPVNVSSYARGLLDPVPLCGHAAGLVTDDRRTAACRIAVDGTYSETVYLTGAVDAPEICSILSGAPPAVALRPGEKDEIPVIADGLSVKPILTFGHAGTEYSVDLPGGSGKGIQTFIVDFDEAARKFSELTGADASLMTGFTASLRISSGASEIYLRRRYEADRSDGGCRLAWLNSRGAVDYYTFPFAAATEISAKKDRIHTAEGCRTVAASAEISKEFVSAAETARTLEWLAEAVSSPRVWVIADGEPQVVDVADGSVSMEHLAPGTMRIRISPAKKSVSRNF